MRSLVLGPSFLVLWSLSAVAHGPSAGAQSVTQLSQRPASAGPELWRRPGGLALVSGFESNAIHVFETATGAFLTTIAPVPGAQSIVTGPDGFVYACAEEADQVLRIDPDALAIVGVLVGDDPLTPEDENAGLDGPTAAVFGPDGNLYVASFDSDEILRFDGVTGEYIDVFVTAGSGGLNGPDAGTTFGPDGNLYVPSFFNNRVIRYDGTSGASLGVFAASSPGNLFQPRDVKFHDGSCYVASSLNNRVLRYDLAGNFLSRFATASTPYSIAFHPDDGNLYIVSLGLNLLRCHDGETGLFLRNVFPSGSGGLVGSTYVYFLTP